VGSGEERIARENINRQSTIHIMVKLSKKIKLELYKLLSKVPDVFGETKGEGIISFLSDIWDLSLMKSEDSRFQNAHGDFVQYLVRNDDYSYEYVFIERLNLLEDDEKFSKFIETVVSLRYRKGEDDISKFLLLLNPYLEKEGYILSLSDYDESGHPIHKLDTLSKASTPNDIKPNDIIFYVEKNPTGRNDWVNSHHKPLIYPSFVLVFDNGWNDYSIRSSFYLFYYENQDEPPTKIGVNKIIYNDEDNTIQFLPDTFTSLDENFCSLGQEEKYYENLKKYFCKDFRGILYALRDAAFFLDIQEDFQNKNTFKRSLIRFDDVERLLREVPYKIYNYDLSNLYSFKYCFKPAYSTDTIDIEFGFNSKSLIPDRIYALIGKNGTGKTQLITSLPIMISQKKDEAFIPKSPLFSKIIAVSYSVFDRFEIPKKSSTFNYCYCGIRKENNEHFSEKELLMRFNDASQKIESLGRIDRWRKILLTFIDEELINLFLIERDDEDSSYRNSYKVDIKNLIDTRNKLSSGQAIILYIITEIVANIRYDSLLLYDEPETHLHPNAITQLMSTIYELTEEFQSYCIMATHSPLIVRELFSKNVYVLDRDSTLPSIRRIPLESFGENLTVLTEEIFGNKGIPKRYQQILRELVDKGKSYDELVSSLEFDEVPLSLNARIFIKSLVETRDDGI
jgi:energy-coupling factor transporter ATP-binding protein EcfA2